MTGPRLTRLGHPALRHFSEISESEMHGMRNACQEAAVLYAISIEMSGLSHNGVHNIYVAIQDAIETEWKKSRHRMAKAL